MVQGVVQKIIEKPWQGKKFYSFALSGQDGFFNTGMKRPPLEGTSIKFNTKKNARGYDEVDGSIEIVTDGGIQPTPSVAGVVSASAKASGGGQSAYWDRKEARDIANDSARELGASRNTAIAFIDLALKNEVVKLPAAAKREEFLWTLLDKYTDKLMGKEKTSLESLERPKDLEPVGPDVGDGDNWS